MINQNHFSQYIIENPEKHIDLVRERLSIDLYNELGESGLYLKMDYSAAIINVELLGISPTDKKIKHFTLIELNLTNLQRLDISKIIKQVKNRLRLLNLLGELYLETLL